MPKASVLYSPAYQMRLGQIEDFIMESTEGNTHVLTKFLDAHDKVIAFLEENPTTATPHPITGDQSWPFWDGRYRLFYRVKTSKDLVTVYLLDLIDNRMCNQHVYPANKILSYDE